MARTVESYVAAAIAFVKLYAALGQEFRRCNHIGSFRIAPESDDGRMFEQQQHVADLLRFSQFDQLLLQAQTRGVINRTELDDRDQINSASPTEPDYTVDNLDLDRSDVCE